MGLEDPTTAELSGRVRRGLGWKAISEATLFTSRLVVAVVLARLLSPEDFGVAGMVLVLSAFVITFADFGFGNALVQRASLTEADRSTMFWTTLGVGALLTALGLAGADLAARFYGEPDVRPLFAALSLSFVVTAVASTQRSLLSRAMDFRSLELRTIASFVAGAIVAIALAAAGAGPWALVAQSLTILAVSSVLLWLLVPWTPRLVFSSKSFRELGGFGVRSVGGSLFTILNDVVDKLVIGRVLGATPLGFYVFAYTIVLQPLTRIVTPVQQVVYPALSRLHADPRAAGDAWLRAYRALGAVCTPLMLGVAVTAPELVPTVFGDGWSSSVSVLQILAWVGVMQSFQGLFPVALQAVGRTSAYLRLAAAAFGLNALAVLAGVEWGIEGVAAALVVSSTVVAVASTVVVARVLGVALLRVGRAMTGVALAAATMVLATVAVRELLLAGVGSREARLVVEVLTAAVVFLAVVAWRDRELVADLRTMLRPGSPGAAAPAVSGVRS